jgi:glycerol-3-phosphate dehydrogenase
MRPAWLIRLGLLLYDHLAPRRMLPASASIRLREHPAGAPLRPEFTRGFVYSDGWVDDARLVVLNARDAADRGARVLTRTRCVAAERIDGRWRATLESDGGQRYEVSARALVNAAGPWAATFLRDAVRARARRGLRLVKGSHIVVPRMFEHPMAYLFQCADGRVVFAIPYEEAFTLIGTTDVEHTGEPGEARCSDQEVAYLCALTAHYFARPVTPADVVWRFSGVRPLLDDESGDPSAISRDYTLELETDGAPLLTVWGGKITTFRRLGEEALDLLLPALGERRPGWTRDAFLPGGDLRAEIGAPDRPDLDIVRFLERMTARFPFLPSELLRRYVLAYGATMPVLLDGVTDLAGLGEEVAPGLFERELRHLVAREWARTGEDVLWRRTKLGLRLSPAERAAVEDWMRTRAPDVAATDPAR